MQPNLDPAWVRVSGSCSGLGSNNSEAYEAELFAQGYGCVCLFAGLVIVGVGLLLSLGSTPAWAQTAGTITGQVTDESSAAIPEAK